METILKLALAVLAARTTAERDGCRAGRLALVGVAFVAAAIALVGALGCAVAALWIRVAPSLGEAGAALVAALAFLVLASVLAGAGALALRRTKPARSNDLLGSLLESGLGEKLIVLLTALVAGIIAESRTAAERPAKD
jgi:hypothetical protein